MSFASIADMADLVALLRRAAPALEGVPAGKEITDWLAGHQMEQHVTPMAGDGPPMTVEALKTAYEFEIRQISDEERRGYQLAICSEGFSCCGWITVIRLYYGNQGWSESPQVLWPQAHGPRPRYATKNFINALMLAMALGETIPRD